MQFIKEYVEMSISIFGLFVLPLGFILFLCPGEQLLWLTIVLSGFTGSSLVTISGLAIQPSYYLAVLWIVQQLIRNKGKIKIYHANVIRPLMLFGAIAAVSIAMPILLMDKVKIMNVDGTIEKLRFSSSNITQLIYLLFVFTFFVFLSGYMAKSNDRKDVVYKAFVFGVVAIAIVTLYQMVAYQLNLPFDTIFKTAMLRDAPSIAKGQMVFWDKRISGPCLEASMLAYYLVAALPVCWRISNIKLKYILTVYLIIVGIITKSSTFLVGFALWIILEMIFYYHNNGFKIISHRKIHKDIPVLCMGAIIVWGACATALSNTENMRTMILNAVEAFGSKLRVENQSGQERSEAFQILMEAFKEHPLLGVGYGSTRGKDLFSTWLSDIGLIGMGAFCVFMFRALKANISRANDQFRMATMLVWGCMLVSVPEPYNLFIWIIMALAIV